MYFLVLFLICLTHIRPMGSAQIDSREQTTNQPVEGATAEEELNPSPGETPPPVETPPPDVDELLEALKLNRADLLDGIPRKREQDVNKGVGGNEGEGVRGAERGEETIGRGSEEGTNQNMDESREKGGVRLQEINEQEQQEQQRDKYGQQQQQQEQEQPHEQQQPGNANQQHAGQQYLMEGVVPGQNVVPGQHVVPVLDGSQNHFQGQHPIHQVPQFLAPVQHHQQQHQQQLHQQRLLQQQQQQHEQQQLHHPQPPHAQALHQLPAFNDVRQQQQQQQPAFQPSNTPAQDYAHVQEGDVPVFGQPQPFHAGSVLDRAGRGLPPDRPGPRVGPGPGHGPRPGHDIGPRGGPHQGPNPRGVGSAGLSVAHLHTDLGLFESDGKVEVKHEFKVHVNPASEECFYQPLKTNSKLYFAFQVLLGADRNIDVLIRRPSGDVIHRDLSAKQGKADLIITEPGVYAICLNNFQNRFSAKFVYFYLVSYIIDQWQSLNDELDAFQSGVRNFTLSLSVIDNAVGAMSSSQALSRQHNSADLYLLLRDNHTVQLWSSILCTFIIISGLVQVYFIRTMFNVKQSQSRSSRLAKLDDNPAVAGLKRLSLIN